MADIVRDMTILPRDLPSMSLPSIVEAHSQVSINEAQSQSQPGKTNIQNISQDRPNFHRLSAAEAVSRFFCFSPQNERARIHPLELDAQRSMSFSTFPESYNQLLEIPALEGQTKAIEESNIKIEGDLESGKVNEIVRQTVIPFKQISLKDEISELPFDIVVKILGHCEANELQIAHCVNKSWNEAARLNLKTLAPSSLDPHRIAKFPRVDNLALEYQSLNRNELAKLPWLKSLGLRKCTFKHPVSDLATLKGLSRLKMKDIGFGEPDGVDLCRLIPQLTELTYLEVSRSSELLYCMPNFQFKALESLQTLVLNDAGLGSKMTHLTQLSELTCLSEISLSKGIVDFDIARSIGSLTQLEKLDFVDVSLFNNAGMEALRGLTNLTRLDLRTIPDGRSEIQDSISVIGDMTKLQYLNLAGHTNLAYFNLDMLSTLKDLKNLNLSGLNLKDYGGNIGPQFLSTLTGLTSLNLLGTLMRGHHFQLLENLKLLRILDMSHTFLDSQCTPHIAAMKDLSTLKINYCPVTNEGLHNIMAGCPSLTYIRTDGCWISPLGMFMAILKRPELTYWSKSDTKLEVGSRPNWYRKLDVIVSVRVQPEHMSLRSFWVKEKSWPLTIGITSVSILAYIMMMLLWLLMILVISVPGVLSLFVFGVVVPPIIFFKRILEGAFKKAQSAMPDAYEWLYLQFFPATPRTSQDRLAELV